MSSLASIADDGNRKYRTSGGGGVLRLDISFVPPGAKQAKKTSGTIHIVVKEGKKLTAHDPYVKLYLSSDGRDVKGTKQKTKAQKKTQDPIYLDRFVYHLKPNMAISHDNRLQITVWNDATRLTKNECCGGFSLTLAEIAKSPKTGWFALMPEADGRFSHTLLGDADDLDPMLIPEPTVDPIAPSPKLTRSASFLNKKGEKKAEKEKKKVEKEQKKSEKGKKKKRLPEPGSKTSIRVDDTPSPEPEESKSLEMLADRFASRVGKQSPMVSKRQMPPPPSATASSSSSSSQDRLAPPEPTLSQLPPDPEPVSRPEPVAVPESKQEPVLSQVQVPINKTETASSMTVKADSFPHTKPEPAAEPKKEADIDDDIPAPSLLRRTNSVTSLASVAAVNVVSMDRIHGWVTIEVISIKRPHSNTLTVKVISAQELSLADPYVKLYLSKDNIDVKSSKRKTKSHKKEKHSEMANPTYNEEFTFPIADDYSSIPDYRLQFSVWDHQRMKANISAGGFSFSINELFSEGRVAGAYDLIDFTEGRSSHRKRDEDDITPSDDELPSIDVTPVTSPVRKAGSLAQLKLPEPPTAKATVAAPAPVASRLNVVKKERPVSGISVSSSVSTDDRGDWQPQPGLKKSNSMESLVSVASGNVISSANVEGELHLYLFFEPGDGQKKSNGSIQVTVNEGRNLSASDPYVKMYLSKKGDNVKSSKQKTKTHKKNKNPLFQEKFTFKLPVKMDIDENSRLQIMVWDHSRSKANECTGGMSFSLAEIASTSRVTGWFELLPYSEGRSTHRASISNSTSFGNGGNSLQSRPERSASGIEPQLPKTTIRSVDSYEQPQQNSEPVSKQKKEKSKRGITSILSKGKNAAAEETENRHIEEKAILEEKIQSYREQVEQMADLQTRNLRLQNKLADATKQLGRVEQLEADVARLTEENENLDTENQRLNEFITLHKDDADARRDQIVVLRDCLSDQKDENKGLRNFMAQLQDELLRIDPKAFARALSTQSSMA